MFHTQHHYVLLHSEVFDYTIDKDGNDVYTRYGEKKTQSNSFSSVSTYRQMYGQLAVDYERHSCYINEIY